MIIPNIYNVYDKYRLTAVRICILGAGGQDIEVQNLHPSIRWKQLVSQFRLHLVNLYIYCT